MNRKTILAIDVGTGMVKVFAGRPQADGRVEIIGSGTAPTGGYTRGVITDCNALAHSIRQAVDCVVMASDSKNTDCMYLGISGSTLSAQNSIGSIASPLSGTITQLDIDRACQAAVFAVANNENDVLHVFPVRESAVHPGEALEVEAHIVSAPKAVMQDLTNALAGNRVNIQGIVASNIVAAEAIKKELPNRPNNFVFMDIGAGTADFVIYANGNLCFSASLPLGGDYITNDLMQGLSVNWAHAEEIKRYYSRLSPDLRNQGVILDCNDYGTTDKNIPFDFLYDIIESRVEEIVSLLHEYLIPLLDKHLPESQGAECIYLTGGSGIMPSMVACVARVFQIHTETVSPTKLAAEYAYPANTVCYGLINHGARVSAHTPVSERSPWNLFIHKAKRLLKI
ncbi:Cell division protein FtsA [Sporomusa rhizae]|uniref:cell division protein FtsA n=1 Tax=Sporomusa rhizae TaxID=357999 RepID=UPI00352BB8E2